MSTIAALLVSQVGMPLAREVIKGLGGRGSKQRFDEALQLTKTGLNVVDALRTVFGAEFDRAISAAAGTGRSGWSYEAGRNEYVELEIQNIDLMDLLALLRDELNLNLDRIQRLYAKEDVQIKNYFRGVFAVWRDRYVDCAGGDSDALTTFAAIDKLLDDTKKSYSDALRVMGRTLLGGGGAVLVLYGILVGSATGMGVVASVSAWAVGLPLGAAAAAVVPGAILIGLATVSLKDRDAMSASVNMAYKLLDRKVATARLH